MGGSSSKLPAAAARRTLPKFSKLPSVKPRAPPAQAWRGEGGDILQERLSQEEREAMGRVLEGRGAQSFDDMLNQVSTTMSISDADAPTTDKAGDLSGSMSAGVRVSAKAEEDRGGEKQARVTVLELEELLSSSDPARVHPKLDADLVDTVRSFVRVPAQEDFVPDASERHL